MLNIGRMGPGAQRYYLDHVAHRADGPEGYYLDRGEAPGRWIGSGLDAVGLSGEVTREQLTAILAGNHPATGQQLASHPARKVPGFDLTFRAPKSVSLLWGLADDHTAGQVQAAHDAAVAAAVGWIEQHAVRSRRGAGGVEQVAVDGLIGAAFRHRTSRAGDPLLHTHVLVANLARTSDDGVWRTLDSRRLFTHARTAGFLYQAHLRAELTRSLGVGWQPVVNGCADLAGVQREWIEAFSKRRAAIVAELAARGETSAAAAQVATLATRQAKPVQPDQMSLREGWSMQAQAHGLPDGWWRPLLYRHQPTGLNVTGLHHQLVIDEQLTADTSTFGTLDVIRAVAERLPSGASVDVIDRTARHLLDAGGDQGRIVELGDQAGGLVEVIRRTDGMLVDASGGDPRFTTTGLLLVEQAAITRALDRRADQVATVDRATVDAVLASRPSLGDDQTRMVRQLTTGGHGVSVVVGRAGTGKTYALDAARQAWTRAGIRVTGVALAARAALELQDSAGIASTTLAQLLNDLDNPAAVGGPLQPGQVLVVDEAGMIGTRPLARLLHHTDRLRVKVVLVGDPHQLPEIDAGGLFVALNRRLDPIELTGNRRQVHQWEQATLDQLRHGNIHAAIDSYRTHGRLITADTADDLRERLVADWWHTHHQHPDQTSIMIALRRADVADLNMRARTRLAAAGMLTGPTIEMDGLTFQAGDRIVCLRNRRHHGLINGLTATVTAVRDDGGLDAVDAHGSPLAIPADYLQAGHLAHGYAITGHKAQGVTVDHTYVLGSETLYREWGYVAMSRGRHTNRLYVHTLDQPDDLHHHQPASRDPVAATVTRLSRSRAETPVSDDAAARWREVSRWLDRDQVRQQPQTVGRYRTLVDQHQQLVAELEPLIAQASQWVGLGVRAATREHRDRTRQSIRGLHTRLERIEREVDQLVRRLDDMPTAQQIVDATREQRRLGMVLHIRARNAARAALQDPPAYLTDLIGPPLDSKTGRARWEHAAYLIEQHRHHWDVTHPALALGHTTDDPDERAARQTTIEALDRHLTPPQQHREYDPPVRARAIRR